jgi:membrane-associated phospholipid phosphatase
MTSERDSSVGVMDSSGDIKGRRFFRDVLPAVASFVYERSQYRMAVLGFDFAILVGMAIVLTGSVLALGGHVRIFQATVLLPLGIMAFAIAVRTKRNASEWHREAETLLRDWVPFLLVVFIYENLRDVAGQFMPFDIAAVLYQMDISIFGVEPTIWAQCIYSPFLTDIMSIAYAIYFALPLFIMFLLSLWGMRCEFRHMALTLTICFIIGFAGYVLLPCSPPRYFIEHLYTDPVRLHGVFLFDWLQGTWDGLSVVSGGAFPSLHVGLSAVALMYAYKFRAMNGTCRYVWFAYIPLVLGLWFATVYLRHHWVIDIFAGILVAILGYAISDHLMRIWLRLRAKHGLSF